MANIQVQRHDETSFRVEVTEGPSQTVHDVTVSAEELRRYGGSAGPERLIEASFEFLLEREPKEAILQSFKLSVIERYFPEYAREIGGRLEG